MAKTAKTVKEQPRSTAIAIKTTGALSAAQRAALDARFSSDEFMYDRVSTLTELKNKAGRVSLVHRYEMGRVLREIKSRRKDAGVAAAAEALGMQSQLAYDVITLHERIPEKTMAALVEGDVNYTQLNQIAHCDDAAVRKKLLADLLNGEQLTNRELRDRISANKEKRGYGGRKLAVPKSLPECSRKIVSGLATVVATMPLYARTFKEKISELPEGGLTPAALLEINQAREKWATTIELLREQLQEVEIALARHNLDEQDNDAVQDDDDDLDDDLDSDDEDDLDDDDDDVLNDAESLADHDDDKDEDEDDEQVTRKSSVAERVSALRRPRE